MSAADGDTVTALAEVIDEYGYEAWDVPRNVWCERFARAVLASGVVTPTAPLHQLAEQWADAPWSRRFEYASDYADELRALLPSTATSPPPSGR